MTFFDGLYLISRRRTNPLKCKRIKLYNIEYPISGIILWHKSIIKKHLWYINLKFKLQRKRLRERFMNIFNFLSLKYRRTNFLEKLFLYLFENVIIPVTRRRHKFLRWKDKRNVRGAIKRLEKRNYKPWQCERVWYIDLFPSRKSTKPRRQSCPMNPLEEKRNEADPRNKGQSKASVSTIRHNETSSCRGISDD